MASELLETHGLVHHEGGENMKKNAFLKHALIGLLVVVMVPFGALSQQTSTPDQTFSEAELDQMLAPIALYPDTLVAQVLIAATYPADVTNADQWVKANPGLTGDTLNNALEQVQWDESIKALASFPQVLDMMAKEMGWTTRLGQAFLSQQADVTASIQRLRQKAYAAGNLKASPQQKVVVAGDAIEIQPADPAVVYVPRYNPVVVYGPWGWPAFPPYAYYPVWPGVVVDDGVFGFFPAIDIGPVWWGSGWGGWDWAGGGVFVNVGWGSHGGHGYHGGGGGGYRAGGGHGGRGGAGGRGTGGTGGGRGTGGGKGTGGKGTGGTGGKGTGTGGGTSHGPATGGATTHGPTTGGASTHGPTTGGASGMQTHGPTTGGGASHGPTTGGATTHGPTTGGASHQTHRVSKGGGGKGGGGASHSTRSVTKGGGGASHATRSGGGGGRGGGGGGKKR